MTTSQRLLAPALTRPGSVAAAREPQQRPGLPGRPLTAAALLATQRTAGNRAARRLVDGRGQAAGRGPALAAGAGGPRVVQRQEAAVGSGGGVYGKHDVDLPAEDSPS